MIKIKSKILFICMVVLAIGFSGCIDDKQDINSFVKSMPEVQQFMESYPNAKISIIYWTKEEVDTNSDEINKQCGRIITPRALYKVIINDPDNTIIGWIDAEKQIAICTMSTPIATLRPTPIKTNIPRSSSTPTLTPTPRPSLIPTLTSTPTSTPTPTPIAEPQEYLVRIKNYQFIPTNGMEINRSDTIQFRNFEDAKQSRILVSVDGIWEDEQYISYMKYVTYTFNESGVYTFYLKGMEDQIWSLNVS